VVELSQFRAALSRGRRVRRADVLLEAADPARAVRALPGDEFYYVLHELGFPDALEILQHGTADQVQTALDFALWDRDQLAPAQVEEWLGALGELPPSVLGPWMKELDVELLALLIRQRARIHDLSEQDAPDEPEGQVLNTPDGLFALELLGEEDEQRITARLLGALYRYDQQWVRRVLVGVRAELDSELEELAYRWRTGRMADLGFADYFDALEVYRELDPSEVHIGASPVPRVRPLIDEEADRFLRIPTALAEQLEGGSPFARAAAGISSRDELANVHAALVSLSNRVLTADRVRPGDDEAATAVLTRMAATLDLAVEFLARGRPEDAVLAVRTVPLVQLFRLGTSLIGKVRKLAVTLQKGTPFARLAPGIELFEPEDAEVLEAVTRLRPLYPRRLDQPPMPGQRPFASLLDLSRATAAVERAGAALSLLYALGVRPEHLEASEARGLGDPRAIDAGVLARTLLARRWLSEKPAPLAPLDARERAELKEKLKSVSEDSAAKEKICAHLRESVGAMWPGGTLPAGAAAVTERWIFELVSGEPVLGSRFG
jgi:hypothetical protein